jgi:hypothetical protein
MHPRGLVFFQYHCQANNKLENALYLVIKGRLNSDCFLCPKPMGCVMGLQIVCPLILGSILESETPIFSKHSLEPQHVGCLWLVC